MISDFIRQKFDEESIKFTPVGTLDPSKQCTISGCMNHLYTKGLCNAHYIRSRKGSDMDTPIKYRSSDTKCGVCGNPVGGKGGWGMCMSHYKRRRRWVMKRAIVEYFGSQCAECNGVFHPAVFDFHHVDGPVKDSDISSMLDAASIDRIDVELAKCKMLCSNCHRLEHHGHN